VLDRFKMEPEAPGPFEWYGWRDVDHWRNRWAQDKLLGEDRSVLMVVNGDEVFGFVAWRKHQRGQSSYCWTMGIGLLPEARGKGYGTRAQRLLVDYLFAHTPVERIEADTEAENIAEQRALEKAGFVREGVIRRASWRDGAWRDGFAYSVIREEWVRSG